MSEKEETIELKPCPRCGGKKIVKGKFDSGWYVGCLECGLNFTLADEPEKFWNSSDYIARQEEDKFAKLQERAEKAEKALKELIEWVDDDDIADSLCTPEYLAIKKAARGIVAEMKGRKP